MLISGIGISCYQTCNRDCLQVLHFSVHCLFNFTFASSCILGMLVAGYSHFRLSRNFLIQAMLKGGF